MRVSDPERHERLTETRWDEGRARAAIERIVADTSRTEKVLALDR